MFQKIFNVDQLLFIAAEDESGKYRLALGETMANTISNKNDSNDDRALMIHLDNEYWKETISGWIALVAIILVFIVILFVFGIH